MGASRVSASGPSIGVSAFGMGARDFVQLSQDVERVGLHSVWMAEHVLLPIGYRSVHPGSDHAAQTEPVVNVGTILSDPLITLAAAALATTRVELMTGILLLPLQHPLVVARAARTLQDLSDGRFTLGVGAGWLAEEFEALGIPFDRRGRRLDESLQILAASSRGGPFSFRGEQFAFDEVQIGQEPSPLPVVLGGQSPAALRRAARFADGWFTSGSPLLSEVLMVRDRLHRACDECERPPIRIHARMAGADPDMVRRYLDAGIDSVVVWADAVWPTSRSLAERRELLNQFAEALADVRT